MAVDHFRYDLLAQEALRGVVRGVLAESARSGLPGEHHFYVTFDTNASGVKISPRLASQHPEEMTIVLQHQFWDLTVTEDAFEVGLSFKGIPERLTVPFAAIKGFFDPSVQFGLQFAADKADAASDTGPEGEGAPVDKPAGALTASSRSTPGTPDQRPGTAAAPAGSEAASGDEESPPSAGGEVVRLDRFRKK